ncbi:MAG: MlaD family protein [Bacteroidales bacterium]|nr:MlaD family protein [Bacteroidales bacterium]
MAERNLRVRLGMFLTLSLAGVAGLVILFGGSPRMFTNQIRYTVVFAEAPGLAIGTPVRKSGVRIGEVASIDLDEGTGEVKIGIIVDPLHRPRPSEIATIARGILNGDTTLDFIPRTKAGFEPVPPADPYPPDAQFSGATPINAQGLLTQASEVLPTAQESLLRIQKSFRRFEEATPKVENALDHFASMADEAQQLLRDLRSTNTKFQELLGSSEPVVSRHHVVAQLGTPPLPGVQPPPPPAEGAGPGHPKPAVPGSPTTPPTVRTVLTEIVGLLRDIRPVAEQLETLLRTDGRELGRTARSIQTTSDNLNTFLTPENQKNVAGLLKNLNEASSDLTKTIRIVAILVDQSERTMRNLNDRLTQGEQVLSNLDKATKPFADNAETIARDVQATVRSLNAAADQLNTTLTSVREVVKMASRSEGTISMLLNDPALFNNLNAAAFEATRTLLRVEKIAKDLEVFADKIARRPELIGLGGVARPSTGLKDAPTAPYQPVSPITPIPPLPPNAQTPTPVVPQGQEPVRPIPPLPGGANMGVPVYRPAIPTPQAAPNDLPPNASR